MDTPVLDFIERYVRSDTLRAHMPGHKGAVLTGPEPRDITEIAGAGELYTSEGPIGQAEENTARLFGTARTCWVTEGSSQCIRAMLALVTQYGGSSRRILAGRNAHRSFLTACALLDLEVSWLWPDSYSLCSCPITPAAVEEALCAADTPYAAVYLTSPDYLGGMQDIAAIAEICHRHDTCLLVDNAHGAYLRFLEPGCHPMQLGADLCCDSAHKTLPALTGCAYLHICKNAPAAFAANAKRALSLFGSTSPSWLLLQSLDAVNAQLAGAFPEKLEATCSALVDIKQKLQQNGWQLLGQEPLKLTLDAAAFGYTGAELARLLRSSGIEPEYTDPEALVLMLSPVQTAADFKKLETILLSIPRKAAIQLSHPVFERPEQVMTIRQAMLANSEMIRTEAAAGRILASPGLTCPPAISVIVSGERIREDAIAVLQHYEIDTVCVVKE